MRAAALGVVFMGALAASLAPYQGLIAIRLFGFSDSAFSALMVAGATMSAIAAIGAGILTDRRGRRKQTALIASAICGAGLALVWVTGSRYAYLAAALIALPVGFSVVGQLFAIAQIAARNGGRQQRDRALGVIRAGFALPFIIILPIWSVAFDQGVGLINIFAATALAAALLFLTVLVLLPADGSEGARETGSGLSLAAALGELLRPRVLLRLGLIAAIVAANAAYMFTMGLVFEAVHPAGVARTARFAGLIAGVEIPFMLLVASLSARMAKSTILLAAALVYAVFMVLFPVLAAGPWVWALVVPAGAGAAVLLTVPIAYFQDLLSDRPGTGSALPSVQMVTSQTIAGGLFWAGTTLGGYATVMALAALASVAAATALWFLDRRADRVSRRIADPPV